jgi:hypothetical protein
MMIAFGIAGAAAFVSAWLYSTAMRSCGVAESNQIGSIILLGSLGSGLISLFVFGIALGIVLAQHT